MKRKIVVLGGYGVFGAYISSELAKWGDHDLVIAGRSVKKGEKFAHSLDVQFSVCDIKDQKSLHKVIEGAFAVINAAGPFTKPSYAVAQACLTAGAHYIDIADGREHVANISSLNEAAHYQNLVICSGASTTPAVTAAMVRELIDDGVHVQAIHSALSPGNQTPRGASTVGTILNYLGTDIPVPVDGKLAMQPIWFEPESVLFPRPVGRRHVYTVNAPDLELFPHHFKAKTVTFKAGMELEIINRPLAIAARLHSRGWLPRLSKRAAWWAELSRILYPFGSPYGAVGVWVTSGERAPFTQQSLALVAERNGPIVAAAPAILLMRKLLNGRFPQRGAFPCIDLLTFSELLAFVTDFGCRAVYGGTAGWREDA